jgi:cyclophilin family peptidyl-prolyl cis-trans isomerase
VLAQLRADYPEDLRVVYRHFPLNSIHDKAALAAQASEAAGLQGLFWEMNDILFDKQGEWSPMSVEQFQEWLIARAGNLGLDTAQFSEDLNSEEIVTTVQETWERGQEIGIPGTPFLLFNGRGYQGPMGYSDLAGIIDFLLLERRQYTSCPPEVIDPNKEYNATLHTEKGDIELELYSTQAPLAVNNFVFLAQEGWYDNVAFHRVITDFMAQTGDPSGTGMGGPGYEFDNENTPELVFDAPGILAMANHGPNTNESQFFITYAPQPELDGGYTIFGRVISGMDVLESLTPRDPSQGGNLPPGDLILGVTIVEK